jgi:hypothetical protein
MEDLRAELFGKPSCPFCLPSSLRKQGDRQLIASAGSTNSSSSTTSSHDGANHTNAPSSPKPLSSHRVPVRAPSISSTSSVEIPVSYYPRARVPLGQAPATTMSPSARHHRAPPSLVASTASSGPVPARALSDSASSMTTSSEGLDHHTPRHHAPQYHAPQHQASQHHTPQHHAPRHHAPHQYAPGLPPRRNPAAPSDISSDTSNEAPSTASSEEIAPARRVPPKKVLLLPVNRTRKSAAVDRANER